MSYFAEILDILYQDIKYGKKVLTNSTTLIGQSKHIAPNAWMHCIFQPLNQIEIGEIESVLKIEIPEQYFKFLSEYSNGLSIYNDSISLDGLRRLKGRNENAVWQPYSIFTPNTIERIKDSKPTDFFIGGYKWDGSLLYIKNDGRVCRCSRLNSAPLNGWNSFQHMLISETKRLSTLFINGIKKDINIPTIPI